MSGQERLAPADERLSRFADEVAEVVRGWPPEEIELQRQFGAVMSMPATPGLHTADTSAPTRAQPVVDAGRAAEPRVNRRLALIIAVLCVAFVATLMGGAWWGTALRRQMALTLERLADVEQRSARAAQESAEQLAATRADGERLAESARRASSETETMLAVLAAPDLVRYGLTSVDSAPVTAQLLWSRSRGLALSAARLPPLPPDSAYQVWLLTGVESVSAGLLVPDDAGRATIVTDSPPSVPRPVVGVSITVEPAGGSAAPSEHIVALNRIVRSTP